MYDFLIVGSGLFGSVFAHLATKAGKTCLIIDKRPQAGGNVYCFNQSGITVHAYGAHIFHTNDEPIWNFVNSFVKFKPYYHQVMANYKGRLYNLPFNMNTFYQLIDVTTPAEVLSILKAGQILNPSNFEDHAINSVGYKVYLSLIRGYTEKQWGRSCKDLPASIIKRIPVRLTFNNNYFDDRYQGIPIGGYNKLIDGLTSGIEVRLNTDFFTDPAYFKSLARTIIYTGPIDQYFGFKFGELEYRSLSFEHKELPVMNYQGCAVMNFTDRETPYTRIIEHKHFEQANTRSTIITYEYPEKWIKGKEAYYPINDEANNKRFIQYQSLASAEKNVLFGGRLACYRYYDMHQIIGMSLSMSAAALI